MKSPWCTALSEACILSEIEARVRWSRRAELLQIGSKVKISFPRRVYLRDACFPPTSSRAFLRNRPSSPPHERRPRIQSHKRERARSTVDTSSLQGTSSIAWVGRERLER